MSNTHLLKQEALRVNELLTDYIALHNKFLKSAGTFWSLFQKVNFRQLADDSKVVFETMRDESTKVQSMVATNGEIEKQFLEVLTKYTEALMNTSYLLYVMVRALQSKAEGVKLSMSEHLTNDKKYKDSIKTYMSYGAELNRLFQMIRD